LALLGACLAVLAWSAGRLAAAGRRVRGAHMTAAQDAAEQLESARQDLEAALDGRDGQPIGPR